MTYANLDTPAALKHRAKVRQVNGGQVAWLHAIGDRLDQRGNALMGWVGHDLPTVFERRPSLGSKPNQKLDSATAC
jgi:hypothetical protein